MIAMPFARQVVDDAGGSRPGADIDAARRLVDHQDLAPAGQPLVASGDLLLIPPGQRRDRRAHARRLHAELVEVEVGQLELAAEIRA
jgi:hypothetical protein